MNDWLWRLPGPARFLDDVESDLRQGNSVLIVVPETEPDGLPEHVADRVVKNDLWIWRRVDSREWMESPDCDPARHLCHLFGSGEPGQVASATTFATDPSCGGLVVWVDCVSAPQWPAWARFLEEFDHAARNAAHDRPRLCVVAAAIEDLEERPRFAVTRLRYWAGVVERVDGTIAALEVTRRNGRPRLHRVLAAEIAAELGGSDVELARHLAGCSLKSLLAPQEMLIEVARTRGWTEDDFVSGACQGRAFEEWEGSTRRCTLSAVLQDGAPEVLRRVWRAQVRVLFPFIEEQRLMLIDENRAIFRAPFMTAFGIVEDVADLEIGHLHSQARSRNAPRDLVRLLHCLTRMRHSLAHLEPVDAADLLDPAVLKRVQ